MLLYWSQPQRGSFPQSHRNLRRIKRLEYKHGGFVNNGPTRKNLKTKGINRNLAHTSIRSRMSVDYIGDCHYTVIAVVLFVEHAVVLLAAIAAFTAAYKAS